MPQLQAASKHARKAAETNEHADAKGRKKDTNIEIRRLQVQVLGGTAQQQVEENRAKLDDKVAENKKYGVRIRNALKKEQDRLDDKAIEASKDDGKKKSA